MTHTHTRLNGHESEQVPATVVSAKVGGDPLQRSKFAWLQDCSIARVQWHASLQLPLWNAPARKPVVSGRKRERERERERDFIGGGYPYPIMLLC